MHGESGRCLPPGPFVGRDGWPWTGATRAQRRPAKARGCAWPRVTIVTPSFNQAPYLEETLRSVLLQDYPSIEYIVMDGGSTDGSREILERYSPYLDHWTSAKDEGQADALNKGFARATGDVLGYINSDDVLLPGAVETVVAHFRRAGRRRPRLVSFSGAEFGAGAIGPAIEAPSSPSIIQWLSSGTSLFQPATFWNRELWERLSGFREDMTFCFDKEFFLRGIFREGAYERGTGEPIALFRLHAESKTSRLTDVWARENARIRSEVTGEKWAQELIAREAQYERGMEVLVSMFRVEGVVSRAKRLAEALREAPALAMTRMFWGAVRRVANSSEE